MSVVLPPADTRSEGQTSNAAYGFAMLPAEKRGKAEDEESSPFEGIQKNIVLNEARVFHEAQINPRKCIRVMTKILYLVVQGETFLSHEATDLFFGVTKLFQSQDPHLRRMIYLVVKSLPVASHESLIVVASLSKDMVSKTDLFRANAIRVLAKIIDASMLVQIDRFMKGAIVDKNPFIVSSALVAGLRLFPISPDTIRRWVNEVQDALKSSHKMVQYHALALLYKIKQNDRLAISKVVTALAKDPPRGPLAQTLLVRYTASVLASQPQPDRELLKFLVDCTHNKHFMVIYEAARALCSLPLLGAANIAPAITVLQEFLSSPLPAQRFAAVRTLSEVVTRFPSLVAPCSVDLEHLINDPNRSIATLAITTLLKTGVEANVDRLMKSIQGFIAEISDEFKVVLVDAIKTLALKFPHKYKSLMHFLSNALREEGGADYKKAIVAALLEIIGAIEEARAEGLEGFCEFIEDCEFPDLSVKILHLLGEEGPRTPNPNKYIRFIFNRTILEAASVRAAAVSALAQFGTTVPALTSSIIVLLKRCLNDNDDEVRDRVVYYLNLLQGDPRYAEVVMKVEPPVPARQLEYSLNEYLTKQHATPFSLEKHLLDLPAEEQTGELKSGGAAEAGAGAGTGAGAGAEQKAGGALAAAAAGLGAAAANPYPEVLNSIPEFAELGPVFRSSNPVSVTEEESEYQVSVVKHIFKQHVVFQFNVTNMMESQQLESVTVEMTPEGEGWSEEMTVPEAKLAYNVSGSCFVCMKRPADSFVSGNISNELKFNAKEVDVDSGTVDDEGVEDSYTLEDLEVTEKDFVKAGEPMSLVEFKSQWEKLGDTTEAAKRYTLSVEDLQSAVDAVRNMMGLQACEDSGTVPEDKRSHAANLYGTFLGGALVMCRAGFLLDQNNQGVTLKVAVRCRDAELAGMFANAIR